MIKENKAGRKKIVYEENFIISLILRCKEERKIITKVKFKDISNYCNELYEKGELEHKLSEDFWRRQGRQGTILLEKFNNVDITKKEHSKKIIKTEVIEELLDGKDKNNKKVLEIAKLNEKIANKEIKRNETLERKIKEQEEELEKVKKELLQKNELITTYEKFLFEIVDNSNDRASTIKNMITTGKTRSEVVENELKNIFAEDIEKLFSKKEENSGIIIPIKKKETKASDDFGEF